MKDYNIKIENVIATSQIGENINLNKISRKIPVFLEPDVKVQDTVASADLGVSLNLNTIFFTPNL